MEIRYEDLVEKVAEEILGDAFEVEAEEEFDPVLEKVAAKLDLASIGRAYKNTATGVGTRAAKAQLQDAILNSPQLKPELVKALNAARAKQIGAVALPAAAIGASAAGAAALAKKRKQSQQVAEKAAAYFEEAQMLKQAAEEAFSEAQLYEDAAIEVLAELGYFDDEE